ncbi:MAG: SRPBCC family protein [Acidimicrobiales bacterium]|nr:SRPBCC family protein [Acidimicrobiales bacterium]
MDTVTSAIQIAASPAVVYALIADVTRTGEWSPECVRCRWIGGATTAAAGARYRGASRNGWRRWSTTSTISVARPGAELVWDVTYLGRPVARWGYRLSELDGGGTLLVESAEDRRERWLHIVSPWITGARDRAARNADTIDTSLHRIKALAEALAGSDSVRERDEGGADLDGRTPPSPGVGG